MNGVEQEIILKPLQFNLTEQADTTINTNDDVRNTVADDTEQATTKNKNKNLDE